MNHRTKIYRTKGESFHRLHAYSKVVVISIYDDGDPINLYTFKETANINFNQIAQAVKVDQLLLLNTFQYMAIKLWRRNYVVSTLGRSGRI